MGAKSQKVNPVKLLQSLVVAALLEWRVYVKVKAAGGLYFGFLVVKYCTHSFFKLHPTVLSMLLFTLFPLTINFVVPTYSHS
jgi:hypothetical protein